MSNFRGAFHFERKLRGTTFLQKCLEVSNYLSTFAADKNLIINEIYR